MRLQGGNAAQMRALADDPGAVVMEHTYEHEFEPWALGRVRGCLSRLRAALARNESCEAACAADGELADFCRLHPQLSALAQRDDFAKFESVLEHILTTTAAYRAGRLSEEMARATVSEVALRGVVDAGLTEPVPERGAVVGGGAAAPPAAADDEAVSARIEELD